MWGLSAGEYAVRDANRVKIFKNFKEKLALKPDFNVEGERGHSWRRIIRFLIYFYCEF